MGKTIKMIFHMAADFIVIISGVYIAFLIRFLGIIPAFNFMPFVRIWYLFGITGIICLYAFNLYNIDIKMNNKQILLKSFQAIAISTIIMMDIAYIMRERVMTFPSSVFLLGIIINTLLCGLWRIFILYDVEEKKG